MIERAAPATEVARATSSELARGSGESHEVGGASTNQTEGLVHRSIPFSPEALRSLVEEAARDWPALAAEIDRRRAEGDLSPSSALKGRVGELSMREAFKHFGAVHELPQLYRAGERSADLLFVAEVLCRLGGQNIDVGTRVIIECKQVGVANVRAEILSGAEQIRQSMVREGATVGFLVLPKETQAQAYTATFHDLKKSLARENIHLVRCLPDSNAIAAALRP